MSDLNLTPLLRKRLKSYPRKIGRYNSSELFGIVRGYTTPEKWLNPVPFGVAQLMGMWNGMLVHDYVQQLLPEELNEIKVVYDHEIEPGHIIQLVAKADHLPDSEDAVWEFKSSNKVHNKSTPSHEFQAKLYCTIHERPIARIFQPVQNKNGVFLKEIGVVERDDVWFKEQMDILSAFHQKVVEASETLVEDKSLI